MSKTAYINNGHYYSVIPPHRKRTAQRVKMGPVYQWEGLRLSAKRSTPHTNVYLGTILVRRERFQITIEMAKYNLFDKKIEIKKGKESGSISYDQEGLDYLSVAPPIRSLGTAYILANMMLHDIIASINTSCVIGALPYYGMEENSTPRALTFYRKYGFNQYSAEEIDKWSNCPVFQPIRIWRTNDSADGVYPYLNIAENAASVFFRHPGTGLPLRDVSIYQRFAGSTERSGWLKERISMLPSLHMDDHPHLLLGNINLEFDPDPRQRSRMEALARVLPPNPWSATP